MRDVAESAGDVEGLFESVVGALVIAGLERRHPRVVHRIDDQEAVTDHATQCDRLVVSRQRLVVVASNPVDVGESHQCEHGRSVVAERLGHLSRFLRKRLGQVGVVLSQGDEAEIRKRDDLVVGSSSIPEECDRLLEQWDCPAPRVCSVPRASP